MPGKFSISYVIEPRVSTYTTGADSPQHAVEKLRAAFGFERVRVFAVKVDGEWQEWQEPAAALLTEAEAHKARNGKA